MMRFEGKKVLITGAGSGIGRAAAIAFANEGATLALADINLDGLKETAAQIEAETCILNCDVSSAAQVKTMVDRAVSFLGGLDCAINNAGIGGPPALTADCEEAVWRKIIDINLTGVWLCMKEQIPFMLANGGSIVNLSSAAGLHGLKRHGAYTAAKHGVIGLTKTAALEYVKKGIRVNAVCPGFTETPLVEKVISFDERMETRLANAMPISRLAKVEEVTTAILFLCAETSSFITGHALPVDGGLAAI